ncbi:hypothetical protein SAY86_024805 [Trapa natans]|uniref:Pectinesterase n=1 Tax=Trapa natans TaxID=22666 RepID=A0AAN7M4Y3_TRANT|nr:hypothetical protein SAY86_024805 [Trapa natans]
MEVATSISPMRFSLCLFLLLLVPRFNSAIPYRKIYVDPQLQDGSVGGESFSTVQAAIDSVPVDNPNWVVIHIKAGSYREKVVIPREKPYIVLKGKGKKWTEIVWDDHHTVADSPTFTISADNIVVKGITFRNSYNNPVNGNPRKPAAAALVSGDNVYFYRVGFFGVQDTLWDDRGRHFFKNCTIQGAVDFIFGNGQSIYEECTISVLGDAIQPNVAGYITAQGRNDPNEATGFVFKNCRVFGSGSANLGRPWRPYARVLFYGCYFSSVVYPQGWDSWGSVGKEYQLTLGEYDCYGPGADRSQRVSWEHNYSQSEVQSLTDPGFIVTHLNSADSQTAEYRDIYVDSHANPDGRDDMFTTVQKAIDSIPENNPSWVVVNIKEGVYSEKVTIPKRKPFIAIKGKGYKSTEIVWDDHRDVLQSPTFTILSDNIIVQGISFRNSYNDPEKNNPKAPAAAALVMGDNVQFYQGCSIEASGFPHGFITAQSRDGPNEPTGFIFKECSVSGTSKVMLGRPWSCHARVLFYGCNFDSNIDPVGWTSWLCGGKESQGKMGEYDCHGPGASQTGRVSWAYKYGEAEVKELTDQSFISASEWLDKPWWLSLP